MHASMAVWNVYFRSPRRTRSARSSAGSAAAYPSRTRRRPVTRASRDSRRSASTMGGHEVAQEPLAAERLVEVALAGVGLPAHPGRGVVVEHDHALERDP